MRRMFNILILLGIISFGRFNLSNENAESSYNRMMPTIKGPVYNPLRQKPYIKFTANV